jgi:hypothetical protein
MADLREKILARRPAIEPVPVPEWDATVYVHAMSAAERYAWAEANDIRKAEGHSPLRNVTVMVIACVRDESGNPIFRDEDAEALEKGDGVVLERVGQIAARLNGMSKEQEEATEKK